MYITTPGTAVRGVAVDYEGHVWAGGYANGYISRHNGETGDFMFMIQMPSGSRSVFAFTFSPNHYLWVSDRSPASRSCHIGLKYSTGTQDWSAGQWTQCLGVGDMKYSYGITVDSKGYVYGASDGNDGVGRWYQDGTDYHFMKSSSSLCDYPAGVTSTPADDDLWMACRRGADHNTVARSRWNAATNQFDSIGKVRNAGRDGVGVDSNGKVWGNGLVAAGRPCSSVAECANPTRTCPTGQNTYISRIDPTTMQVDMRVCTKKGSYTYGDMTGNTRVASGGASITGEYRDVIDSGTDRTLWTTLLWNEQTGYCATTPTTCTFTFAAGESISAFVRTFDDVAKWDATETEIPYIAVSASGSFLEVPQGRYLQVKFQLEKAKLEDPGPVLYNVRATYEGATMGGKAVAS
jgi:hypothetical protein